MIIRKLITLFTVLMLLITSTASAQTQSSTITVGGTDYTLYTGFTATAGTASYANFVDGNTSTQWQVFKNDDPNAPFNDFAGGTEDPAYVEFHADAPFIPKGYILTYDNTYNENWKPTSWALKAKLNESDNWTTIHSSNSSLGDGSRFEIACNNDGDNKYQYFRFEIYDVGTTYLSVLDELEFYGNSSYTHLTVRSATCTEIGIKRECWQRDSDGKYFSDANGTTELDESAVVEPMKAHTCVHHEASATNTEYWQCSVCGKYFSDETCTNEISEAEASIGVFGALADGRYTLSSQTYTLTGDENTAGYIYVPAGVTATIDLAGHTIDRGLTSADNNGTVIIVAGTLTITDSGTGGKIQDGYDGYADQGFYVSGIEVQNGATLNLQGGTLIGRNQDDDYTVFVDNTGTFTMTGGKITGGWGGVRAAGTVAISGGEISGNSQYGVNITTDNFSVSGNPVITNNTKANVKIFSWLVINVVGALTDGANIGITAYPSDDNAPVTVTSGYGTYNSAAPDTYFTLDNNVQIQTSPTEYMTVALGWNQDKTEIAVGTTVRTVTFDMNGHGDAIEAVSLLSGYKVSEPTAPTADDWNFVGWFTDAGCTAGNEYDFDNAVTSDLTLHALWTQGTVYQFTLPDKMVIVSRTNTPVGNWYPAGTVIKFKAAPDYVVDGDVSDGTNTLSADGDGIYTVTITDADITITATLKKTVEPNKTLSGSESYTAHDGDVLTGSTSGTVTIANNASITLSDATITGGIVCEGTAEITLVGTNNVTGATNMAGIQVGGSGTTLTIKGNGSLTTNGGTHSAGIGLSRAWDVDATGGDIVIEGGIITATGNGLGAGIGTGVCWGNSSDKTATLGNISIKGGTVYAVGGGQDNSAGIGKGHAYAYGHASVGTVSIYDDINIVNASSISETITYMHGETNVTEDKTNYFTIIEDGNRSVVAPKDDTDYTITIADGIEHGNIACAATTAKYGDQITITATPDFGYRQSRLVVKDAQNKDVASTGNSFFMPKSNVTVSATFIQTTAAFDEATGVLTLNGNVDADEVKAYGAVIDDFGAIYEYSPVTTVVCEPGTVLPVDCSELFLNFYNTSYNLTIDLSNADVSGVTNMSQMFGGDCLTTIYVNSAWSMENVTSSNQMFADCWALIGGKGTGWMEIEDSNGSETAMSSTYAIIDGIDGQSGYLTQKKGTPVITTAPSAKTDLVYNGEGQELITAGTTNFGNLLSYSLDGEYYSADIPTATDAGTYTVYYKVEGSNNWNAVEAATVEATIAKKATTLGALTLTEDQNGTTAVIDGNSTESLSINSEDGIEVKSVTYSRTFTADGGAYTIMLPFDFTVTDAIKGTFHTLSSIAPTTENPAVWKAEMSDAITTIEANKPYIFMPSGDFDKMIFENVTLEKTTSAPLTNVCENTNWKLHGVYSQKVWTENNLNEYGFAATAKDGISVGEFVHFVKGASLKPTRCYLEYSKDVFSKSAVVLPEKIIVVFPETSSVIEPNDPENNGGDVITPVSEITPSNGTKVWSADKKIVIESKAGDQYRIIDLTGRTLRESRLTADREEVTLSRAAGIVIVKINGKSFKINY